MGRGQSKHISWQSANQGLAGKWKFKPACRCACSQRGWVLRTYVHSDTTPGQAGAASTIPGFLIACRAAGVMPVAEACRSVILVLNTCHQYLVFSLQLHDETVQFQFSCSSVQRSSYSCANCFSGSHLLILHQNFLPFLVISRNIKH